MNKIVIVTLTTGTMYWLPYTQETLDYISNVSLVHVSKIQVVECHNPNVQYIITKTV